ncbi:DUF2332 domain-containing protein [Natronosalvus rutilus]|uniref:DUF2332 domain-containing protein n=1 Tax=Natronosalvus rutilus TaxID=2953753 RepID=A0A9E7NDU5_9EURY|nr:DUF2332 domain-containing protein [Natronosalvus rutilus]UTF55193.1 DUF2332 domain-containing protein [Natronosalvus rutilus]
MSLEDDFEWYADWASDVSPLYERLARGAADDPTLLDIAADASAGQPAPQLLLGAVHALLLDGDEHALADFYSTRTDDPEAGDPYPHFREFCLTRESRIRDIVRSRRVQTNAVGRSAVLVPAFEHVSRIAGRDSLALVEVGASAGLNLRWDRYRHEYAGYGSYGPNSAVRIEPLVRGDVAPPLSNSRPEVVRRLGIDLNPLDVTDPADVRWMRALVIPDQRRRHERLRAAIEVAREDPPKVIAGDALDVLPDVIAGLPEDATPCVFSTHTLYQLEEDGVAALRDALARCSQRRRQPIHWLSDDPFSERGVPTYRYALLSDGTMEATRLTEYQSYGEWIRWLADSGR